MKAWKIGLGIGIAVAGAVALAAFAPALAGAAGIAGLIGTAGETLVGLPLLSTIGPWLLGMAGGSALGVTLGATGAVAAGAAVGGVAGGIVDTGLDNSHGSHAAPEEKVQQNTRKDTTTKQSSPDEKSTTKTVSHNQSLQNNIQSAPDAQGGPSIPRTGQDAQGDGKSIPRTGQDEQKMPKQDAASASYKPSSTPANHSGPAQNNINSEGKEVVGEWTGRNAGESVGERMLGGGR